MHVGRVDRPLEPPRWPWEVGLVAFEIARRHRFLGDLAVAAGPVEVHVMPTGQPDPPKYNDLSALRYRVTGDVGREHRARPRRVASRTSTSGSLMRSRRLVRRRRWSRRSSWPPSSRCSSPRQCWLRSRRCCRRCSADAGRSRADARARVRDRRTSPAVAGVRGALGRRARRACTGPLRGPALVRRRRRAHRAAGRARARDDHGSERAEAALARRSGRWSCSASTPARATRCSSSTSCSAATAGGRGS